MEAEPYQAAILLIYNIVINSFDIKTIIEVLILVILLVSSGLISASEVAFFSLNPNELEKIHKTKSSKNKQISQLLSNPEKFLATILISNTLVNIAIVVISTNLTNDLIDFKNNQLFAFLFQTVAITSLILFFGEIFPKAYATQFKLKIVNKLAFPLSFLNKLFYPVSFLLIKLSDVFKKRFKKKNNVTINNLSHALDIASNELHDEEELLKGIVKFGNINVKEIIIPRVDVVTVDLKFSFTKVLQVVIDSGYSRIPVVSDNFDNVKGVLYIKDLLPHIHKPDFKWQSLIRPPFFIPETKKINDLLEEFQLKKNHMAIVFDEYGGTSGIVTLEDIIEEIVGDIEDEFDNEEGDFVKISENEFIFEGKTLLNDFCRTLNINSDSFDNLKGEADTLAGLILEVKGTIPNKNEIISIENFDFKIKSVDSRRIKQLFVTLKK